MPDTIQDPEFVAEAKAALAALITKRRGLIRRITDTPVATLMDQLASVQNAIRVTEAVIEEETGMAANEATSDPLDQTSS